MENFIFLCSVMFLSRFLIKIADEEQLVIAELNERGENHLVRLDALISCHKKAK